jgi:hypothetical protein
VADLLKNLPDLRLLLLETVDLESEHFDRARQISESTDNEAGSWQLYLNVLAQLSLVKWLGNRISDLAISSDDRFSLATFGKIQVNNFKLTTIATEQIVAVAPVGLHHHREHTRYQSRKKSHNAEQFLN